MSPAGRHRPGLSGLRLGTPLRNSTPGAVTPSPRRVGSGRRHHRPTVTTAAAGACAAGVGSPLSEHVDTPSLASPAEDRLLKALEVNHAASPLKAPVQRPPQVVRNATLARALSEEHREAMLRHLVRQLEGPSVAPAHREDMVSALRGLGVQGGFITDAYVSVPAATASVHAQAPHWTDRLERGLPRWARPVPVGPIHLGCVGPCTVLCWECHPPQLARP